MKRLLSIFCTLVSLSHSSAGLPNTANERVSGINSFAFELFARVSEPRSNVVISPLSVHVALVSTYAGARGNTAAQIAKTLHFSNRTNHIHEDYHTLITQLNERNTPPNSEFELSNALFMPKGFQIHKPFQELLSEFYGTTVNQISFTGRPNAPDINKAESARDQMNSWVATRTKKRIETILPPSWQDTDTSIILINTIWFKGQWAQPFQKAYTKNLPFYVSSDEVVSVPTMRLTARLRYAETKAIKLIELPYVSNHFSMIIVLPNEHQRLTDIERTLSLAQFMQLRQKSRFEEVGIKLPRFSLSEGRSLVEHLRAMGLKDCFSANDADFSGITPEKPFYIGELLHSANVEIDEEGTKASAATILDFSKGLPIFFNANQPFLFFICDNRTGLMIFLGRIADPSKM